jgi:hypothetical protein
MNKLQPVQLNMHERFYIINQSKNIFHFKQSSQLEVCGATFGEAWDEMRRKSEFPDGYEIRWSNCFWDEIW